jgi:hypothetical protein
MDVKANFPYVICLKWKKNVRTKEKKERRPEELFVDQEM